jgi:uncharacterized protein (TIGR00369 family)
MTDTSDRLFNMAQIMNFGSPQAMALGLRTVEIEHGRVVMTAPYREDMIGNPATGVIAGGVVTTMLDHASGQAVYAALDDSEAIATLDLRIDYMRRAEPGRDLFVEAHCYRVTHAIAFVRAIAYDLDKNDPVATAQSAFMLNASAGRPAGANLKPPAAKTRKKP